MARVKEFDEEAALQIAIATFAGRGFEGTSTDDLLRAMKIGRQSLYDTFGDKRTLYLAALKKYGTESVRSMIAMLDRAPSSLAGIEAVFLDFAKNPRRLGSSSCLGVSSICEFGRSDPDVAAINDEATKLLERAFERHVKNGIADGEMAADLVPRDVARYLSTSLAGLKVAGVGGATPAQLVPIARLILRTLAAK
jgi:AcrR family transcriptional regulator